MRDTVNRKAAIHQLFNVLQDNLEKAGYDALANNVDVLHHDFTDAVEELEQSLRDLAYRMNRLDARIPNEDLATWIDG